MQVEKKYCQKLQNFKRRLKSKWSYCAWRCQVKAPDPKCMLPLMLMPAMRALTHCATATFWEDAGREIIIVFPLFRLWLVVFCICCDWMSVALSFLSHARWFVFYALNDATLQKIHERKIEEKTDKRGPAFWITCGEIMQNFFDSRREYAPGDYAPEYRKTLHALYSF